MKYLPPLVFVVISLSIATAADELPVPSMDTEGFPEAIQPAYPADLRVVTNRTILGPTGELLPPVMATQLLGKRDYYEWCLRWNKRQHELTKERAIPPRELRGWVTKHRGFVRRGYAESTTQSYEQSWLIGGHGGGPVTLYNPFVPPTSTAWPLPAPATRRRAPH